MHLKNWTLLYAMARDSTVLQPATFYLCLIPSHSNKYTMALSLTAKEKDVRDLNEDTFRKALPARITLPSGNSDAALETSERTVRVSAR